MAPGPGSGIKTDETLAFAMVGPWMLWGIVSTWTRTLAWTWHGCFAEWIGSQFYGAWMLRTLSNITKPKP